MKNKSIVTVIFCSIMLAALFLSIGYASAADSPTITLTPPWGCVGTPVTISGQNFGINRDKVTITYESYTQRFDLTNGDFSVTIPVPASSIGEHTVTAFSGSGANIKVATAIFTVTKIPTEVSVQFTPKTIDLNGNTELSIGGRVTSLLDGSGVAGNVQIYYYLVGTPLQLHPLVIDTAGANGYYGISHDLPPNTPLGTYIIVAKYLGDDNHLTSEVMSGPPNLVVLPEYLFGGLAAMAACFGAFIVIKKRRSLMR